MKDLRSISLYLGLVALIASLVVACGDDPGPDVGDVGDDVDRDADIGDATDDADTTDDADDADVEPGEPCLIDEDCGNGEDCIEDVCTVRPSTPCDLQGDCDPDQVCTSAGCVPAPFCRSLDNWIRCGRDLDAIEPGLGRFGICRDSACVVGCQLDSECADGEICTDYGSCRAFEGDLSAPGPGGGSRAPLQAGFGRAFLDFTIGVPLGGYGSRARSNDGRYALVLEASIGSFDGLYADAALLDNGEHELVFVRMPTVFPSAHIHERVCRQLQEETGIDWRDSLVISSTHTHSGPARLWRIPRDTAVSIGVLGAGEFRQEVEDGQVQSIVDAVLAAIDDKAPARFGWDIIEAFDTDDVFARDRWNATPPFDDNRMLLMRVDDMDGDVRGVLFSFGSHATDNESNYATTDMSGGAEFGLSTALSEREGRYVPALYLNENGGSMSHAGGTQGHSFPHSRERLGALIVDRFLDDLDAIQTSSDISLSSKTYRFPITYDYMYERDEWKGAAGVPLGGEYSTGAIQCGGTFDDRDYSTYMEPGVMDCLSVRLLAHNRNPSIFARSQVTAIEIDGLSAITAPGEITMELGWEVLRNLRDVHGIDPLAAWVFGYAQDHLLYLTPTNVRGELPVFPGISTPQPPEDYPDFAMSYLQGGYEPSLTPWGWKFGDFFIERAVDAFFMLDDADYSPSIPEVLPQQFSPLIEEAIVIDSTADTHIGSVLLDVPALVHRFDPVDFEWIGGDPGAEAPQVPRVALMRSGEGGFSEVVLPNTLPYDNRSPYIATRVVPRDGNWVWAVRWEELKSFETGIYRFDVTGSYKNAAGDIVPYATQSSAFELRATDEVAIEASVDAGTVVAKLSYPTQTAMNISDDDTDQGALTGSLRMRHFMVPTGVPDPLFSGEDIEGDGVVVTVRDGGAILFSGSPADDAIVTAGESAGGRNNVPTTRMRLTPVPALAPGTYDVEVSVTDRWGNTGTTTFSAGF